MKGSIRSRREFDAVYEHGARRHGRFAVLFFLAPEERCRLLGDEGAGEARVGIVASRRVGGAVRRNRAKRVLRAASRELTGTLEPGSRMVIVARRNLVAEGVRTPEVRDELHRLFERCLRGEGIAS